MLREGTCIEYVVLLVALCRNSGRRHVYTRAGLFYFVATTETCRKFPSAGLGVDTKRNDS